MKKVVDPFFLYQIGWIKPKRQKPFHATVPLNEKNKYDKIVHFFTILSDHDTPLSIYILQYFSRFDLRCWFYANKHRNIQKITEI